MSILLTRYEKQCKHLRLVIYKFVMSLLDRCFRLTIPPSKHSIKIFTSVIFFEFKEHAEHDLTVLLHLQNLWVGSTCIIFCPLINTFLMSLFKLYLSLCSLFFSCLRITNVPLTLTLRLCAMLFVSFHISFCCSLAYWLMVFFLFFFPPIIQLWDPFLVPHC